MEEGGVGEGEGRKEERRKGERERGGKGGREGGREGEVSHLLQQALGTAVVERWLGIDLKRMVGISLGGHEHQLCLHSGVVREETANREEEVDLLSYPPPTGVGGVSVCSTC